MKIQLYQVLVTVIAIVLICQGIIKFIKGRSGQTFFKLFVRIVVWGSMALIAIFPKFTITLAKIIGLEGNINAVILTGFILIFLIIFKLLSAIEKLEQQMTEVTRRESLNNLKQKN